ncbi:N-acetyltransferase family protein [Arenibacter sp. F26102]|uniref:GNAT family N-acetyltransferase n=1 Tax=Arenibacter sp. F26102 TaxID=2926416 RepID=UPI001FF52876|nr:GNAT family N-acetyltransferase [Arenibacter sp. F26102]MCK0144500.1 N-acetyltransferase family protein [Arenibacter sp. F26102]
MEIRKMTNSDWPRVAQIYQEGMDTGFATFEKEVPTFHMWDAAHLKIGRLVAASGETILGWAALSPVSSRCVYGGVAEVSIYIAQENRGQGLGKLLMQQLIVESEKAGFWTLQSGIFPENKGSVELHLKMGFRFIGKRERIGKRDNVWKDNLLFERRSALVGLH